MVGTETLAMVVSSTTRKLPSPINRAAAINGLPVRGLAGAAAGFAIAMALMTLALFGLTGNVDVGVHGKPDAEGIGGKLLGVQRNAHGQPLHHLDPIARRVLRRNDGKRRACAAGETRHPAVIDHLIAV